MIVIETLAHKIAEKIALQLEFDENKKAVVAYGLIGMLQTATIFIIITMIGIIFNFWYESVVIFAAVGFIRKSTGGAHSKTMNGCIVMSVFIITMLSALSRYLLGLPLNIYINIGCSIIIFTLCFLVFFLRVPVDNPNKPIVKPEKIRRLRKQSFLKLVLLFILSIVMIEFATSYKRFYGVAFSIQLAMLWQTLTLTKTGTLLLNNIDSKVGRFMEKR